MSIEAIMTTPVVSILMDEPIRLAGQYFKNKAFHHLPVINSKRQVQGIVSDRDFLQAVSPYLNTPSETRRDTELMLRKVHTIMTRNPITISKDCTISEASGLLLESAVSSLLVVNDDQVLLGILTLKDIARTLANLNVDIVDDQLVDLSFHAEESADPNPQYI